MKPISLKTAIITSFVLVALLIGVGMYYTDVVLAGKISPAQDAAISAKFGEMMGMGVGLVWGYFFTARLMNKKK